MHGTLGQVATLVDAGKPVGVVFDERFVRVPDGWDPEPKAAYVVEAAGTFARRSGILPQAAYRAILTGLVPGSWERASDRPGSRMRWTVRLEDPSATAADFMARLDAADLALSSIYDLRWYNRQRVLTGSAKEPIPDHWAVRYAAREDSFEGDTHEAELCALITAPRPEIKRVGQAIDLIRSGVARAARVSPIAGDVRAALRDALDDAVPDLEGTCLEKAIGKHIEAPTAGQAARLLEVSGRHRTIAIVDTVDAIANADLADVDPLPLSHSRIAKVLKGVDCGDKKTTRRRLRAYLKGRILPRIPNWARVQDVFNYLACETRMASWAREPIGKDLSTWLLANKPDVPRDAPFMRILIRAHERLRRKGTARRRERADFIADNFDRLLNECEAKHAFTDLMMRKVEEGHANAGSDPDFRFSFEAPIHDGDHRETGFTMLVNMRSVLVAHQLQRLGDAARDHPHYRENGIVVSARPGGDRHDERFCGTRVAIFEGVCRLDQAGPEPSDPDFVEALRYGATLRPRLLTDEQLMRRRSFLSATGLPTARLAAPGVITGSGSKERKVMLWSLVLMNEIIVPTVALHRGMSIARVVYRVMCMASVRVTTSRQMIDDQVRGWTSVLTGRELKPAFISIPKLPHELRALPPEQKRRAFPLDSLTIMAIRDLIALTIRLDGGDLVEPKRLRIIPPTSCSRMPSECGDDRYVLQANGCLLDTSQLGYCVSFMFLRRFLPHDSRHASATVRHDEGETLLGVGKVLGQTSPRHTQGYAKRGKGRTSPGRTAAFLENRDRIEGFGFSKRRPAVPGKPARSPRGPRKRR